MEVELGSIAKRAIANLLEVFDCIVIQLRSFEFNHGDSLNV